jgi:hypothetical protein
VVFLFSLVVHHIFTRNSCSNARRLATKISARLVSYTQSAYQANSFI